MERERERAVRFSNLEIEVLVDLIKTHIIVEERRIDCSNNAVKRKAWENITNEFWSRTSSNRTEFQLLKKWKNLKHAARKYEAAINSKELGRSPPIRSPILEEVLDVIKREQEVGKNGGYADTRFSLATKIKEEQVDDYNNTVGVDSRLCPQRITNWESEVHPCVPENLSVNNEVRVRRMEEDMTIEPVHFVPNGCSTSFGKQIERTNPYEHGGNASDDAISVGGYSDASQNVHPRVSSVSAQTCQQMKVNCSGESSKSNLVHEKDLALKSAQLALLEKENKIKELDIKIREEQLTDIIIRRKQEQELHELRMRKMLQGLHDGR